MSDALTEPDEALDLLPNLGAEEGDDWRAVQTLPTVRVAAHLWLLLQGPGARLCFPPVPQSAGAPWSEVSRESLWPKALGAPHPERVFRHGPAPAGPEAWLNTRRLTEIVARERHGPLAGCAAERVEALHDKAFAVNAGRELRLNARELSEALRVLSPEDLRDPDHLLPALERVLDDWPTWMGKRFTLKPRSGSSGRGRVGGEGVLDTERVRGALPRLAKRGGAILEPWLERVGDFSVGFWLPPAPSTEALPTLLGSLEMWTSPGGLYLGHCGETDSRGRVFSGDAEDEALRADAAVLAAEARRRGYWGPCGVDSFRYRAGPPDDVSAPIRLRTGVEFNARMTMGLVTAGLVRRALPRVREPLDLTPGARRGFALIYRSGGAELRPAPAWRAELRSRLGPEAQILSLASPNHADLPEPFLIFARERAAIEAVRADLLGC